jgi:hypothetical protein
MREGMINTGDIIRVTVEIKDYTKGKEQYSIK